jgi:hypothetical protein
METKVRTTESEVIKTLVATEVISRFAYRNQKFSPYIQ